MFYVLKTVHYYASKHVQSLKKFSGRTKCCGISLIDSIKLYKEVIRSLCHYDIHIKIETMCVNNKVFYHKCFSGNQF